MAGILSQTLFADTSWSFWAFFVALLGYCSQSVLGRTHSLEVLPSQTLTWSLSLDCLGYCCPECPRSQTISWRFFRRRHSPGVFPWISLNTVVQSVLGRAHFPGGSSVTFCEHEVYDHIFFYPDVYFMLMLSPSGRIAFISRFVIRTRS